MGYKIGTLVSNKKGTWKCVVLEIYNDCKASCNNKQYKVLIIKAPFLQGKKIVYRNLTNRDLVAKGKFSKNQMETLRLLYEER